MSWRMVALSGCGCSMAGALAGAVSAAYLAFGTPEMMAGATVGAITGSVIGWHLLVRRDVKATPAPPGAPS